MSVRRFFNDKKPIISIGDNFVDKKWGDTILRICKISDDNLNVRYKFITIEGRIILGSGLYEMTVCYLLDKFRKI